MGLPCVATLFLEAFLNIQECLAAEGVVEHVTKAAAAQDNQKRRVGPRLRPQPTKSRLWKLWSVKLEGLKSVFPLIFFPSQNLILNSDRRQWANLGELCRAGRSFSSYAYTGAAICQAESG